jgi:hypothetical protein
MCCVLSSNRGGVTRAAAPSTQCSQRTGLSDVMVYVYGAEVKVVRLCSVGGAAV